MQTHTKRFIPSSSAKKISFLQDSSYVANKNKNEQIVQPSSFPWGNCNCRIISRRWTRVRFVEQLTYTATQKKTSIERSELVATKWEGRLLQHASADVPRERVHASCYTCSDCKEIHAYLRASQRVPSYRTSVVIGRGIHCTSPPSATFIWSLIHWVPPLFLLNAQTTPQFCESSPTWENLWQWWGKKLCIGNANSLGTRSKPSSCEIKSGHSLILEVARLLEFLTGHSLTRTSHLRMHGAENNVTHSNSTKHRLSMTGNTVEFTFHSNRNI